MGSGFGPLGETVFSARTSPDGIHVVAVTQNKPPKASPYDMVRDRVLADYRADKINRMQAGADAFLAKPFTANDVEAIVARAVALTSDV